VTALLRARLALVGATLAVSASAIAIRLAHADAATVVWLRMVIAVALLLPWALRDVDALWRRLDGRQRRLVFASGVLLAVHFLTWTASLAYTSVASSVLLVSLHPVMVAPLGARWLGESLDRRTIAGIGLALLGTVITCAGDLRVGGSALGGDLLALVGAVALALYLLIGRRMRRVQSAAAYSASVYAVVAVSGIAVAATTSSLHAPEARTLLACLFLGAVCTVGGHTVFNWALRHVNAATVSVAFLAEPPLAALYALLLLAEQPAITTLVGAPLILGGMFLTLRAAPADAVPVEAAST
jgi:drug/metabolite transporter (DMT)-like permease